MSAKKQRPAFGAPITPDMSHRDQAAAVGVSSTELARWKAMGKLPNEEFERRLAYLQAHGELATSTAVLRVPGEPVPARERVQRAIALWRHMTHEEQRRFLRLAGLRPVWPFGGDR